MEQETRKISASQLAAVLAKVDGRANAEARAEDVSVARPVSGTTPRVADAAPSDAEASPPSAAPQVLAVVDRPVGEGNVVNRTSPEAPRPTSSGRIEVGEVGADEASSARAIVNAAARAPAAPLATGATDATEGATIGAALVVLLFVACCVLLVWFNH